VIRREMRQATGLTIDRAAIAAEMSWAGWRRIEVATRRTRHSTLERMAKVLAEPLGMVPSEVYDELVRRAGIALAPESVYRERGEARRKRRIQKTIARARLVRIQAEKWRAVRAGVEAYERRLFGR
jgi:hypothetical protein